MEFNSHFFVLIFLPTVVFVAFLFPKRLHLVLLVSSLTFYGWDSIIGLILLIFSTVLIHYGKKISLLFHNKSFKKLLYSSIILLVIIPFVFFRAASLDDFILNDLILQYPVFAILPAGISFYTFQLIGYLVDDVPDFERLTFFDSLLFTSFFPQLIAGPIEKANNLIPQLLKLNLTSHTFRLPNVKHGLLMITLGLFFKTFFSDVFASLLPENYFQLGLINSIIYIFSNGLILYFDFLGYSLIALGLAFLFNIRLTLNFNRPYAAVNIRQFWRCWHITLTRWFTTYIYKSIASPFNFTLQAKLTATIVVFLFTALWHGFGLRFLVWGIFHMLFVSLTFVPLFAFFIDKIPKYLNWFITFFIVNSLWVFFLFPFEKSLLIFDSLYNPSSLFSIDSNLRFILLFALTFIISLIYNPSVLMLHYIRDHSSIELVDDIDYSLNIQSSPDMILSSFSCSFTQYVNSFLSQPIVLSLLLFACITHFSFASTFVYFRF